MIAVGLLIFQLAASVALFLNLVLPLARRSAGDLADLLVLSARIWEQLPEDRRPRFEAELRDNHGLTLREAPVPLPTETSPYPYLRFLRSELLAHLGAERMPVVSETAHEDFQVEFAQDGHRLRFEFSKAKITPRPSRALLWIAGTGVAATLVLAWLLARRVTAPVSRLAEAARRFGGEGTPQMLPETGDAEFADLARVFNETARQLHARRENQRTLLGGISHDLRSPLGRMKMALGMLAEDCPSPLIARLERDVAEMDMLIGAQLDLARAQELEPAQTTDIDALLRDLVDAAEAQAPGRIRLYTGSPACLAEVAPVALRRSIGNLLDNALRYGGDGDIVVVRRRFGGVLFLGVRDRGQGIPPDHAEAVFRPFYRIESSRNRSTGGSGLGLAITRQLAETHGWKALVKPRRPVGTSAWVVIPLIGHGR
jgi:two-component system osmolarity sensor histidine kinase EnvZ